jgi:hypothetical protein
MATFALVSGRGFAFVLECEKEEMDERWLGARLFACWTKNMNITTRGAIMTSTTAAHIDNVKTLRTFNQIVNFMPKFETSLAMRLEAFQAQNCGMKSLEKDDLKQFPNLRLLALLGNELEWLDGDVFEFTPKLEVIGFHSNKLKFIGAKILQPLTSLTVAYFDGNKCIDYIAGTREQIEELKQKLVSQCPPLPSEVQVEKQFYKEKLINIENSHNAKTKLLTEAEKKIETLKNQQKIDKASRELEAKENSDLKSKLDSSEREAREACESRDLLAKKNTECEAKLSALTISV